MFWIVFILFSLAFVFFKLGTVSVWLGVFTLGFKLLLTTVVILGIAIVVQKWRHGRVLRKFNFGERE